MSTFALSRRPLILHGGFASSFQEGCRIKPLNENKATNHAIHVRAGNGLMISGGDSRRVALSQRVRIKCGSESIRSRNAGDVSERGSLKRLKRGRERESPEGSFSAVDGMSSEILYLLDPAQGVCILEGNISRCVEGKRRWLRLRPGGSTHPLPGP